MTADPMRTAAFSGHRSFKIAAGERERIAARLRETVAALADEGVDTFLSGMAEGFDLMAARAVVELKAQRPGIRLIAVIPFPGQAERFPPAVVAEYRELLKAADETVVVSPVYDPGVYHRRNDYLLDHSMHLVCYYNGSPGGTRYCWKLATGRGLHPVNLYERTQGPGGGRLF